MTRNCRFCGDEFVVGRKKHSVKLDSSGNTYGAYTVIECPEFELDRRFI